MRLPWLEGSSPCSQCRLGQVKTNAENGVLGEGWLMFLQGQYSVTGTFLLTFNSCSATLACSYHLWTYVPFWGCNGTEDMHQGRSKFKLPPTCHYNTEKNAEKNVWELNTEGKRSPMLQLRRSLLPANNQEIQPIKASFCDFFLI